MTVQVHAYMTTRAGGEEPLISKRALDAANDQLVREIEKVAGLTEQLRGAKQAVDHGRCNDRVAELCGDKTELREILAARERQLSTALTEGAKYRLRSEAQEETIERLQAKVDELEQWPAFVMAAPATATLVDQSDAIANLTHQIGVLERANGEMSRGMHKRYRTIECLRNRERNLEAEVAQERALVKELSDQAEAAEDELHRVLAYGPTGKPPAAVVHNVVHKITGFRPVKELMAEEDARDGLTAMTLAVDELPYFFDTARPLPLANESDPRSFETVRNTVDAATAATALPLVERVRQLAEKVPDLAGLLDDDPVEKFTDQARAHRGSIRRRLYQTLRWMWGRDA